MKAAVGVGLLGWALLAGGGVFAQTVPASSVEPPADALSAIAGSWEMTDTKKKSCRFTLGTAQTAQGYVLGSPPACKAAIPAMAHAAAWRIGPDRSISFIDAKGETLATFIAEPRGRFGATSPERLTLVPVGEGIQPDDRFATVSTALMKATAEDLPALQPAALAGLYGVAREKGKPICSIELSNRVAGARGGRYIAILSGGCIDPGLKIFDPVTWYTERGRLYLVAKKGHEQGFAPAKDGVFEKSPPAGAQIYLKKQ